MASSPPPPAQVPQLVLLDYVSSPVPSYNTFILQLRQEALKAASNPEASIEVLVTLGFKTVVMQLNSNLWCTKFGRLANGEPQWFELSFQNYPGTAFNISAKEWVKSVETMDKWVSSDGKGMNYGNAPFIMIFFVSEAARLEPVRLQAEALQTSAEAFIPWLTVLPLLQNWKKLCAGKPTLAVTVAQCLSGSPAFTGATLAWLQSMAAAQGPDG
jgi:hypothetical protein